MRKARIEKLQPEPVRSRLRRAVLEGNVVPHRVAEASDGVSWATVKAFLDGETENPHQRVLRSISDALDYLLAQPQPEAAVPQAEAATPRSGGASGGSTAVSSSSGTASAGMNFQSEEERRGYVRAMIEAAEVAHGDLGQWLAKAHAALTAPVAGTAPVGRERSPAETVRRLQESLQQSGAAPAETGTDR